MADVPSLVYDPVRLDALERYHILDTAPEIGFDDVAALARTLCETPIALVSLVADKRQWFKAVSGLDVCQTPIEQSVCAHALEQGSTLNIPDLTLDPRTKDNTLVTGPPHIRFYAGALLQTPSGTLLGTVCVIDTAPRPGGLTSIQLRSLEALARQVMTHLELRRAKIEAEKLNASLDETESRLRLSQDAGRIGSFEITIPANIMTVTDRFCSIYGLPPDHRIEPEVVERLVHPEDREKISNRNSRLNPKLPLVVEYRINKADTGELAWISRRAQFILDKDEKPLRLLGTVHDITERKNAELQLHLVNLELNHRIKNTLAIVQAIASQSLAKIDPDAVENFRARISALARAQDTIVHQSGRSANIADVVASALDAHGGKQRFSQIGPFLELGSKATLSMSLLLHELGTNATKYGALSVPTGHVDVSWSIEGQDLTLCWRERGGPTVQAPTRTGFGSKLIDLGLLGSRRVSRSYDAGGHSATFSADVASLIEGA